MSYFILRLKCTKFNFGWGQTPLVELTALPETPRGPSSKGREREG